MLDPDTPIDCVGWIVETVITDYAGRKSYRNSPIYRRAEDAERIAKLSAMKPLPGETITRTVRTCCTAFPLSAVLAGEATRWEDYELLQEIADEVVLEDRGEVRAIALTRTGALALRAEPRSASHRFPLRSPIAGEAA